MIDKLEREPPSTLLVRPLYNLSTLLVNLSTLQDAINWQRKQQDMIEELEREMAALLARPEPLYRQHHFERIDHFQ